MLKYGKYDGFQMNEAGRIKAALYRLSDSAHPVSEEDIPWVVAVINSTLVRMYAGND